MIKDEAIKLLAEAIGEDRIKKDEPMSKHTTFRIGGPADLMLEPLNTDGLKSVIAILKKFDIPYFVMGNGSNLLVGDKGIRGAVINISQGFSEYSVNKGVIRAGSGLKLSRLANIAVNNSLTGLEFASGIPGTLGGAVYMNAGAYGGEMKDIIKSVTYFDTEAEEVCTISGEECGFGYRKSIFSEGKKIVTEAVVSLEKGDSAEIKNKMAELCEKRNSKQPVDKPSAGSTFKRPEGYFAGTLIQDAGLKGFKIGGAEVSQKHSGFIINAGGATAKDVCDLIGYVKETVLQKFGVELEPEVKFTGEF